MTMLVGGEAGVLGEAADPLGRISSDIVYCGSLGDGYRVKLLNQFVKYSRFLVASEALIYAEMSGLDPSAVLAGLMSGTGAAAGLATAEEMFGDDAEAVARHAPVNTITKDVELARVMFAKADFASPSFDALAEFFLAAGASELRHRPYPEAVRLLEEFRTPAHQDPAC
jgi:3-hydroxyisobutyrate dehydrogenase-like beta-hydroxyacid dehydrogenase